MKKNIKIIVMLFSIVLVLLLNFKSLSRFLTGHSGSGNIQIAKWNVKLNNSTSTVSINLKDTLIANNYSSEIVPGSSGYFSLNLDFTGVEVAAEYEIVINYSTSNLPALLKFYSDSEYTEEFPLKGVVNLSGNKQKTINIYWKWLYTKGGVNDLQWLEDDFIVNLDIQAKQKLSGDV